MSKMSADEIRGMFARYGRNSAPRILYEADFNFLVKDEDFPGLLAHAWTIAEYPTDQLDIEVWVDWFSTTPFHDGEGNLIERPKENMVLYRGSLPENRHSLSWTTDREQAQWFANRIPGAKVYRFEAKPDDLWADYRDDRNESEVIVNAWGLGDGNVTEVGEGDPGDEEAQMVAHLVWLSNRA